MGFSPAFSDGKTAFECEHMHAPAKLLFLSETPTREAKSGEAVLATGVGGELPPTREETVFCCPTPAGSRWHGVTAPPAPSPELAPDEGHHPPPPQQGPVTHFTYAQDCETLLPTPPIRHNARILIPTTTNRPMKMS